MPRVPQQVQQSGQTPQLRGTQVTPMRSFVGEQQEQMGQAMLQAAGGLGRVEDVAQDRFDTAEVLRADNQLVKDNDAVLRSEKGYLNTLGQHTAKGRESTLQALEANQERATQNLTETQRAAFQARLQSRMQEARRSVDGHHAEQMRVYEAGQLKEGIDLAVDDAVRSHDPVEGTRGFVVKAGLALRQADQLADTLGWGEDDPRRRGLLLDVTTRLHAGIVQDLVDKKQPDRAREYLSRVPENEVKLKVLGDLHGLVERGTLDDRSQRLATAALADALAAQQSSAVQIDIATIRRDYQGPSAQETQGPPEAVPREQRGSLPSRQPADLGDDAEFEDWVSQQPREMQQRLRRQRERLRQVSAGPEYQGPPPAPEAQGPPAPLASVVGGQLPVSYEERVETARQMARRPDFRAAAATAIESVQQAYGRGDIPIEVRDDAIGRITKDAQLKLGQQHAADEQLVIGAQNTLIQNPLTSWRDLPVAVRNGLADSGQLPNIINFSDSGNRYATDHKAMGEIVEMASQRPHELRDMSAATFRNRYRGRLNPQDFATAQAIHANANEVKDPKYTALYGSEQEFEEDAKRREIIPRQGKWSDEQHADFAKWREENQKRLRAFEADPARQGKPATPEEREALRDQAAIDLRRKGRLRESTFGVDWLNRDTIKSFADMTPYERAKAVIDLPSGAQVRLSAASSTKKNLATGKTDIEEIIDVLRGANLPVTAESVLEYWAKYYRPHRVEE